MLLHGISHVAIIDRRILFTIVVQRLDDASLGPFDGATIEVLTEFLCGGCDRC